MIPVVAELVYNSCYKFFIACHHLSSATLSLLAFLDRSTNQHMLRPLRHDNRQLYLDKFLFPCLSVMPVLLCGVTDSLDHCKLVLRVLKTAMTCQISEVLEVFRNQLPQLFGLVHVIPNNIYMYIYPITLYMYICLLGMICYKVYIINTVLYYVL